MNKKINDKAHLGYEYLNIEAVSGNESLSPKRSPIDTTKDVPIDTTKGAPPKAPPKK